MYYMLPFLDDGQSNRYVKHPQHLCQEAPTPFLDGGGEQPVGLGQFDETRNPDERRERERELDVICWQAPTMAAT